MAVTTLRWGWPGSTPSFTCARARCRTCACEPPFCISPRRARIRMRSSSLGRLWPQSAPFGARNRPARAGLIWARTRASGPSTHAGVSGPDHEAYRVDPLRARTCRCSRCATCTGRMRLGDGLSWAQEPYDAWFTRASLAPRRFASCDPHSLNPSPTLIAPARHARHILAHTSSQTISYRDLSLGSSRRLVYLAAIAWSRARRPCATPNMTASSP